MTLKEFWLTMLFLALLFFSRLFFLHQDYVEFKEKPFFYTDVQVLQAYEKWNAEEYHTILKVYSPVLDLNFFSRTRIRAKEIKSKLRLKLFPHKKMTFFDYLGTSFMFSRVNTVYEDNQSIKVNFLTFIEKQHENNMIASFYKAIYFATPLDKALRQQVSSLGISHLIALSGFHLAILSGLLFFLLRPIYRFFQQKYFSYRFDLHDVGLLVLIILAWYVWFVDAPPSLVRSFAMMVVGWLLLVLGVELLSFSFLMSIILVILVIFPKMLLSLAFWFSVAGVFYIFLLLKHFSKLNKYSMTLFISFGIFVLMLPIVHLIFPIVNPLQLTSPFLSLVFSLFYPFSMGFHLFGVGDLVDSILVKIFTLSSKEYDFLLPLKYGTFYLLLSLGAIYSKKMFYLLLFSSTVFTIWLFMGFWV